MGPDQLLKEHAGAACAARLTGIVLLSVLIPCAFSFQSPAPPDPATTSITGPNVPATAKINFTVKNYGDQAVTTDVAFYRGDPRFGSATEFGRMSVSLNPGATLYPGTPDTYQFRDGEIFTVCIDPDRTTADSNRNNNCLSHTVSNDYTNLKLDTTDLAVTPVGPDVGEPMTVSAKVHNAGTKDATTVLRLWQGHPLAPKSVLLGQTQVSVPAQGQNAAFWTLMRPAGDTNLWVAADNVAPRETSTADSLASRNMFLKATIDTGRRVVWNYALSTMPAIADLFGTGQPVMVFTEDEDRDTNGIPVRGHVTAVEVYPDGTHKELWSKVLVPDPSEAMTPVIADIDGDGSAEIIVEVVRRITNQIPNWGEIYVFVLDRNGDTKWSHQWRTATPPCHRPVWANGPVLGDINGDGIPDITIIERELVTVDGRNGNELVRAPWTQQNYCVQDAYSIVADVDSDGKNEIVVGYQGIHVFNSDGTKRWETPMSNIWEFALVDVEADGVPEVVIPVHRQGIEILDARTGAQKKWVSSLLPWFRTIAATTSLLPSGLPALILSQNDAFPATAAYDGSLNRLWFQDRRFATTADNPMNIVLADVLGQGRPQIISRTDRRVIRIQDIRDGTFLFDPSIYGYAAQNYAWPAPVDVDGDGRAEIVVPFNGGSGGTILDFEPTYPIVDFLVFGSVHWGKLPTVWNQLLFNQQQLDSRLAWRNDYQPWKTHNTWRQQPVRKACDLDQDADVDSDDVNALMALRGTPATAGDPRDIDKDGMITVADARACALKCTLANCTVIRPPARILSLTPRMGYPGTSVTTTIRAEFAGFQQDVTTVNFGAGIAVGAVTVLDANTLRATLTIASGQTGTRTVTVSTGATQATRIDGFSLSPDNKPPVVNAGATIDTTEVLPATISLNGSVTDDGLPAGGKLVCTWQQIAGPGTVQFGDSTKPATSATFPAQGFYTLRLSASDGELFTVDDVGVRVVAGNQAPLVNAGGNRTTQLDVPITLAGTVDDDGLPFGSTVTILWTEQSGPGTVSFGTPASATTTATFSAPGTYALRLSATDTLLSSSSDITVTVNPPLPRIAGLAPNSAVPGQTRAVTIAGQYTNFGQGATQVSFGPGVSVGGGPAGEFGPVTVDSPTSATAQISVATGAALGPRTIGVRTGEEFASAAGAFTVGTIGVPYSIQIDLSARIVAPGGSLTASPKALDAAGNVLPFPASSFQMQVQAEAGAATGNAPVLSGLTVTFPKLNKRVINQNPVEDPAGKYASGDPTDPNYGKETGGIYTLTVTLPGTSLSGSTRIAALPSGSAAFTLRTGQYAAALGAALDSLRRALLNGDPAGQAAGWEQLRQVDATLDFRAALLRGNNVLTPPNGYPVSTTALIAHGFRNGTDDTRFSRLLDTLISQSRSLTTRIQALNVASLTQADLDALKTAAAAFSGLQAQLVLLKPSPLAITQNVAKLNTLVPLETPKLLDAMKSKALDIMNLVAPPAGSSIAQPLAATTGVSFSAAASFDLEQFLEVCSNLFGIFTDLKGAAMGNIEELAFSLANDLLNIAAANLINSSMPAAGIDISFVSAGSGFSFVCPHIPGTYVEGIGFSSDLNRMAVAQIGCINSAALRSLLALKPVQDLAAAIGLFSDIRTLAGEFERDGGIASDEQPDSIREGVLEGKDLVFNNGWQQVNQGGLPCVGIVIVFNFETGGMRAVNADILAECN